VARKNVADAAKAKAEKQKKMVIALGVVLALAMGYAVHTMMSLNKADAGSKPQVAAAADTTSSSTPAPATATPATPSALPAAPDLSGLSPTSATPTASSSPLISAVKAPADAGQLQSFSLFESKDPFNAGGPKSGSSGSGSSGGSSSGSGPSTPSKPPATPPAPPTPPPTSAVISVNGSSESVTTGSNFPAANPMFQLVSLTASSAKVAVADGSYASGAATLSLKVNKPVTLVNTADGTRYTLTLLPQGTQASSTASSSSGTTSTTPTSTTPTTGG